MQEQKAENTVCSRDLIRDTTGWSQYANVTKIQDDEKYLVSRAKILRTMGYLRDRVDHGGQLLPRLPEDNTSSAIK
ncbi:PREDICTED: uncharacterized protein LOC105147591 isoform X2 [Acromyrmex echinatior]|uniref:uncharacterized protein LOC105147591 isoform X2 n=1 Tax=Acromyrmex echinatior TaxID=103372 RepID=UPI000580C839|nr:PREDICTED: uncharacterized protein LOC105147591 isoform X2 [Acromyrmex echinatior]